MHNYNFAYSAQKIQICQLLATSTPIPSWRRLCSKASDFSKTLHATISLESYEILISSSTASEKPTQNTIATRIVYRSVAFIDTRPKQL